MDIFKNKTKTKTVECSFYVLRCFCLSAVALNKDPPPDQKKKHPLALVCSVNMDLFLKDTQVYCKKKKKEKQWSVLSFCGLQGQRESPVMLRAQGWRSKVIGHLSIQITLHPFLQSCPLLHKHKFLLKQQLHRQTGETTWSFGDGCFARRPVRTLFSVMSPVQLQRKCLRGM